MKFENLNTRTANELGVLLRHWRAVKASSTCLSTRVCRKSRSASSRADGASPVVRLWWSWLNALDIPLRDRNTLLLAGGYAPIYSESDWDSMEMKSVTDA